MTPLGEMTDAALRELADATQRRRRQRPVDMTGWTREMLVAHVEGLAPAAPAPRVRRPRMPKNLGVGRYCRELLARVVEIGPDGPRGLGYMDMVRMIRKKFPESAADERHLRWYACQMRAEGRDVPADRPRSSWIKKRRK